jgi:hypothetical protein
MIVSGVCRRTKNIRGLDNKLAPMDELNESMLYNAAPVKVSNIAPKPRIYGWHISYDENKDLRHYTN